MVGQGGHRPAHCVRSQSLLYRGEVDLPSELEDEDGDPADEEDPVAEGVGDAPDDRLYVFETSSHTFTTAAGSSLKREGRSVG